MTNKKIIKLVLKDSVKDKRILKAQIRLKGNGRFSSFTGQIHNIKTNKDGDQYMIVNNFNGKVRKDGKRWQSVRVDNVIQIKKDGKLYR